MALQMTYREILRDFAGYENSIFTLDDADELGVPAVEVHKMARRGVVKRVGVGVYRHLDLPTTLYTEFAVAVRSVGANAYLAGESVLHMHDLAFVNPRGITVGTPDRLRRKVPPQVTVMERRAVEAEDLTTYWGVPSETVSKALTDGINYLMEDRVIDAADTAQKIGLITPNEFDRIVRQVQEKKKSLAV
ncbi:type IV toxin-antitoxin system AbiEi family antitoxin domain-containing protein [Corynebacterium sp. LK2510]|uniref:type IV toxin-antitoxin system AbiEi family antitoxin domain-containing protein n=1 Tax=Corynebacterium sp. LK2510 TaxID=3110472 RepID=UPI0034CE2A35